MAKSGPFHCFHSAQLFQKSEGDQFGIKNKKVPPQANGPGHVCISRQGPTLRRAVIAILAEGEGGYSVLCIIFHAHHFQEGKKFCHSFFRKYDFPMQNFSKKNLVNNFQ